MTMMLPSTVGACRNLGGLASRVSSSSTRQSSTFLRASASTISSSNGTKNLPSFHTPRHHAMASPHLLPSSNATTSTPQTRSLSMMPRRGFPQYTIFGPDSALGVRSVMPQFKRAGNDGIAVDRRGKIVLEFVPRNNSGAGFAWSDKTMFSLTPEELGFLLHQLPDNSVELTHPLFNNAQGGEDSGVMQTSGEAVEKVLTIEPGEGSTLTFKVDYMKGGVGGQTPPGTEGFPPTPVEVTIQAGEFEVLKSIFQTSIPYILGWNTTMDIASAAAMSKGVSGGDNNMY